jgi:hypothetical protein
MSRRLLSLLPLIWGVFLIPASSLAAGPYRFYSVNPCRIVDTRLPNGPTGGPILAAGVQRSFPINNNCSVPPTATAAVLNLTVVTPATGGHITAWPFGTPQPSTSTLNYDVGDTALANGAIIPLTSGASNIYVVSAATAHMIIDVTGYFQ